MKSVILVMGSFTRENGANYLVDSAWSARPGRVRGLAPEVGPESVVGGLTGLGVESSV